MVGLTRYVLGKDSAHNVRNTTFYKKLVRVVHVDKHAHKNVKKALENGRLALDTAYKISTVDDKLVQVQLGQLAKNKSSSEIKRDVDEVMENQRKRKIKKKAVIT